MIRTSEARQGAGVVQTLVNHVPPHDFLLVPFAGHCALSRVNSSVSEVVAAGFGSARGGMVVKWGASGACRVPAG